MLHSAPPGLAEERPNAKHLPDSQFAAEAGLPWKAIARRMGRARNACFRRWHFWLSPRARRASGRAGEQCSLRDDLALVTALHASGAEDESEILWSNLIPGLSLARNRFRFLARRFGCAGDGPLPDFGACVERLKTLLEQALEEEEVRARRAAAEAGEFRDECTASLEAAAKARRRPDPAPATPHPARRTPHAAPRTPPTMVHLRRRHPAP